MNPYLPVDKQRIDDIPIDDEDDCDLDRPMTEGEEEIARDLGRHMAQAFCSHEEYHMGRCVACSASQIDGAYPPKQKPLRAVVVTKHLMLPKSLTLVVSHDTSKKAILSKRVIMQLGSVTKKLIIGCLFAIVILAVLYIADRAYSKQELVTCEQLKSYSQRYIGFYLTQSEKQMCDRYGVTIYAPVK